MEDYSVHWNARLASSVGALAAYTCVVKDANGEYLPSTAANRTATGRKTAGIAKTGADSINRSFGFQFVGVIGKDSVPTVGAGTQGQVISVNSSGLLVRGGTVGVDDIVGVADADGTCYVLFGGVAAALGGGGTPGGSDTYVQFNNAGAFGGMAEHTYHGSGRENLTTTAYFSHGPTNGTYPSAGLIRIATITGDGDNTNNANYRWLGMARKSTANVPMIGGYWYPSGAFDVLIGGRHDFVKGTDTVPDCYVWADVFTYKFLTQIAIFTTATANPYRYKYGTAQTSDATITTLDSRTLYGKVTQVDCIVTANTSTPTSKVFKFSCPFNGTTPHSSGELNPSYTSAGTLACTCVLDVSSNSVRVRGTGVASTTIDWTIQWSLQGSS